jgi:hypothetical protein
VILLSVLSERPSRRRLEARCRLLEHERDLALGQAKAAVGQLAAWVAGRATAHRLAAEHLDKALVTADELVKHQLAENARAHRITADELDDVARDAEAMGEKP